VASKKGKGLFGERLRGVEEVFAEVRGQLMGKIGIGLIVFFVIVSIYALATVPLSFADKWLDLTYWSKYPSVVPPTWVSAFGVPVAPFVDKVVDSPDSVQFQPVPVDYYGVKLFGVVQKFSFTYRLREPAFPQGIVVYAHQVVLENLTIGGRIVSPKNVSLTAVVLLHRPDNLTLIVSDPIVTTLSDFVSSGAVLRFSDVTVAEQLEKYYREKGVNITASTIQNNAARFAFGVYDPETGSIKPLTGTYTVEVVFTYLARGVNPNLLVGEI
jgi:hypothetical protein